MRDVGADSTVPPTAHVVGDSGADAFGIGISPAAVAVTPAIIIDIIMPTVAVGAQLEIIHQGLVRVVVTHVIMVGILLEELTELAAPATLVGTQTALVGPLAVDHAPLGNSARLQEHGMLTLADGADQGTPPTLVHGVVMPADGVPTHQEMVTVIAGAVRPAGLIQETDRRVAPPVMQDIMPAGQVTAPVARVPTESMLHLGELGIVCGVNMDSIRDMLPDTVAAVLLDSI
eukprot:gb/GECG01013835.1/.p1 GENE.gb/GECG01013835.1/~~gb/GECG01013835.1/.p1  ORF type:complete len:231 (+),score=15.52 gb/GECG01013835.1/:1-693(+)